MCIVYSSIFNIEDKTNELGFRDDPRKLNDNSTCIKK